MEDSHFGYIEKFPEKHWVEAVFVFFKFVRYLGWQSSTRGLTRFGYVSKEENR
jgi:hypothetical protein